MVSPVYSSEMEVRKSEGVKVAVASKDPLQRGQSEHMPVFWATRNLPLSSIFDSGMPRPPLIQGAFKDGGGAAEAEVRFHVRFHVREQPRRSGSSRENPTTIAALGRCEDAG